MYQQYDTDKIVAWCNTYVPGVRVTRLANGLVNSVARLGHSSRYQVEGQIHEQLLMIGDQGTRNLCGSYVHNRANAPNLVDTGASLQFGNGDFHAQMHLGELFTGIVSKPASSRSSGCCSPSEQPRK